MHILIFAGTIEGRTLAETLAEKGVSIDVRVATDYGKELFNTELAATGVEAGRLNFEEMKTLMSGKAYDLVVDATHPYAILVSENIKEACLNTGVEYMRLLRSSALDVEPATKAGYIVVENTEQAIDFLNTVTGKVLLTTGSKDLKKYIGLNDFASRLYPRLLPAEGAVEACVALGYKKDHLICMQGPFSYEMNRAMLEHCGCEYMVTKDSGKAGGTYEKIQAALDCGVGCIVIGRPVKEEGLSLEEVEKEILNRAGGDRPSGSASTAEDGWFPLFVNLYGREALIIGGGKIATRRAKVLADFGCKLRVVTKAASADMEALVVDLSKEDRARLHLREFSIEDLEGIKLVIVATDDREVNREIGLLCRGWGILVNVADSKEECDFYFPGIAKSGKLTAGILAGGQDHTLARKATEEVRKSLKELSK